MKLGPSSLIDHFPSHPQSLSSPFANFPFDILLHIFEMGALIVDDETRFSFMLLCKVVHDLVSKVHYRIMFIKKTQDGLASRHNFSKFMNTRRPGFFQAIVGAFWLSPTFSTTNFLTSGDILSFKNLRHIAFGPYAYSDTYIPRRLRHGIQNILCIPLESLWLLGSLIFLFARVVKDAERRKDTNGVPNPPSSFYAFQTLTHVCSTGWSTSPVTEVQIDGEVKTFLCRFMVLSHIAIDLAPSFSGPSSGFVRWLYNQENYRLVILLCHRHEDTAFHSLEQNRGVKVVQLDCTQLPEYRTLWKRSVIPLEDWRGVWGKGEATRKKAEEPDLPELPTNWLMNMILD
ncbi:hypothetical protein DL96DRAFT_235770 [Flagelloscypha sp. PMI_526]|nr:hypothetical protein DL96DRAFT_235770 [Flagelloscypha sp. PMI_526]